MHATLLRGAAAAAEPSTAWRRLVETFRRARRRAAARRAFDELDDRTLRDAGIARSEFGSYWAESEGLVEATRLRVLLGAHAIGARWS